MLSYQHIYHAGNLADVQKHAALAVALDYLTQKNKPLTYMESHAGRGLYLLDAPEALKTGEAAQGIDKVAHWFAPDHPYARAIAATRRDHGPRAYPGSPLIAAQILRDLDTLHLADLHPRENVALQNAISPFGARIHQMDGLEMALSLTPPDPRRGLLLIDPSYELRSDYAAIPGKIAAIARKWPVGIIMLWYPILTDGPHTPMLDALVRDFPDATRHEVHFPPARDGHRMVGSGLFIINTPFGLQPELDRLGALYKTL
ncbi:23S rRNA (adenine2030-N6)-methyltransferase [Ketogulonicigenium robustum]|uniref:Ribosomal RNA large subunit methyltransferase J n=1 Tax=Ketogulonicigenium robustum TaxID=92947 RepID=A0A1W6NY14_9RHOB|nr:23S rRNA (adenine(2030)-N(6))-methyltransferase RlmJ [Ketogulonicigenium robustum]ARO13907.1 23S rRNA (adenine2030-N6)-methyltransferase [Ketogulonicigenium robustum]